MKSLSFFLPTLVMLASCSTIAPYPEQWGDLGGESLIGECPMLSGVYQEHGQAPDGCQTWQEACYSLRYALLSGGVSYKKFFGKEQPVGPQTRIQLTQQTERMLEIVALDVNGSIVHQETLSMNEGDFSCDGARLALRGRPIAVVVGLSNVFGSESRGFSRSGDGSLVMESRQSIIMNHTFFPFAGTNSIWIRWRPVE